MIFNVHLSGTIPRHAAPNNQGTELQYHLSCVAWCAGDSWMSSFPCDTFTHHFTIFAIFVVRVAASFILCVSRNLRTFWFV